MKVFFYFDAINIVYLDPPCVVIETENSISWLSQELYIRENFNSVNYHGVKSRELRVKTACVVAELTNTLAKLTSQIKVIFEISSKIANVSYGKFIQ